MTRKQSLVITALTILVLALGVLASRQLWFRLDITRERLNTISEVSRNLHMEIADTVQITYFVSDRLRALHPMPGEIEDFLREYVGHSRGRMRLAVRDPVRADMVREVERFGILPQHIPIVERDVESLVTVFSGIVIEYLDEVSVLPMVFSLETLEYDLTSRIRSMARGTPRVAGILAGGMAANPRLWEDSYLQLHAALAQAGYEVRFIAPGEEIPGALSALIVLDGTETLDDLALYRVDRYLRGGGRALFTARAVAVDVQGGMEARRLSDRGLLAMLASYGAEVSPEIVMDQTALAMRYQARTPAGALQVRVARNFQWIRVLPEFRNPLHPVVGARFAGLDLYWANPITLSPPPGVEAEPLFTTTDAAWTMLAPFLTSPDMADMMERDAAETAIGRRILAASLSGVFPSWFEGRPSPAEERGLPPSPPIGYPRPGRVIVVGETEFATAFTGVTGAQHNFGFIIQAADWLGHEDDIIGIRARAAGSGRLDRIADPEVRAAAIRFSRAVNVFVVPALVIAAGAFFSRRRRALARLRGEADPGGEGGGGEKELGNGV